MLCLEYRLNEWFNPLLLLESSSDISIGVSLSVFIIGGGIFSSNERSSDSIDPVGKRRFFGLVMFVFLLDLFSCDCSRNGSNFVLLFHGHKMWILFKREVCTVYDASLTFLFVCSRNGSNFLFLFQRYLPLFPNFVPSLCDIRCVTIQRRGTDKGG